MTSKKRPPEDSGGRYAKYRAAYAEERQADPAAFRLTRELDRLRDLLGQPWWSARDAAYIFAGLEPKLTNGEPRGEWGPAWLPDGQNMYSSTADRFQHGLEVEAELEGLFDVFAGDIRSPKEWIKHAVKFDVRPPWLASALRDDECSKHIPQEWYDHKSNHDNSRSMQSAGGKRRSEIDPASIAMRKIAAEEFPAEFEKYGRLENGGVKRGWRARFARKMAARHSVSEGGVKNRLREWIEEFERKKAECHSAMQPDKK